MTKVVKLKTGSATEEQGSYSRLVMVDKLIFISNTAGRHPVTKEMPEDAAGQLLQIFDNLERALTSVGSCLADIVSYKVYVPDPDDFPAVAKIIGDKFKGIDPALTVTSSPLMAPYYKVEMEATAYHGASVADTEYINISDQD
ncbi:MAG: Rid family hydrolase [Pseudomonadota bacterium]